MPNFLKEHPRQRRLLGLVLTALLIELALIAVAWFGPAFRVLLRPVYVVVATIFVWLIWKSGKRRKGDDRRQGDRRVQL